MELVNLKDKKEYSLQDMMRLLRIGIKTARKVKEELIKIQIENNINIKNGNQYRVKRKLLEDFLKTKKCQSIINNCEHRFPITTIDSKDDILARELMNTKDICILLNCSDEQALEISKEIKLKMRQKGIPLLLDHFLTSYFLEYIDNKNNEAH
jgi:uncharacterized protein (UPF0216 family)